MKGFDNGVRLRLIPKKVQDRIVEVLEEEFRYKVIDKDRVRDHKFYYDYGKFIKEVRLEVIPKLEWE